MHQDGNEHQHMHSHHHHAPVRTTNLLIEASIIAVYTDNHIDIDTYENINTTHLVMQCMIDTK